MVCDCCVVCCSCVVLLLFMWCMCAWCCVCVGMRCYAMFCSVFSGNVLGLVWWLVFGCEFGVVVVVLLCVVDVVCLCCVVLVVGVSLRFVLVVLFVVV